MFNFSSTYKVLKIAFICSSLLFIGACGDDGWFGKSKNKVKLEGERLSILTHDSKLKIADNGNHVDPIKLPAMQSNKNWRQTGYAADHYPVHLQVKGPLEKIWQTSIGTGSSHRNQLLVTPIVSNGKIFTMDCHCRVSAFDETSGKKLWQVSIKPKQEREILHAGGLVASANDDLFVASAYGEVLKIGAEKGEIIWRKETGSPIRAAPVFHQGKIYVQTADNRVFAMDAEDGKTIWKTTGIAENTALLAASSPAAKDNLVVAPFSSGELNILNADTGRLFFTENLSNARRIGANTGLSDIKAPPVITNDLIISVSHSGKLFATDKRSGVRRWEQNIGGMNMPWVTPDTLYIISQDAELIALKTQTGEVAWIKELKKYKSEKKKDHIVWRGPVLASERLWLTNSLGEMHEISPYNGENIGEMSFGKAIISAPIIVNNAMLLQLENGSLLKLEAPQKG